MGSSCGQFMSNVMLFGALPFLQVLFIEILTLVATAMLLSV